MKVYELARELNLKSVQLLEKVRKEHNMPVKNHMQNLSAEEVHKIKSFFRPVKKTSKKKPAVQKRKAPAKKKVESKESRTKVEEKPVLRTGVIRRSRAEQTKQKAKAVAAKSKKSQQEEDKKAKTESETKSSALRASGDRNILPGLVQGETQSALKNINEIIDITEEEKKKAKKASLEKESQSRQFRATDFRKREVIFQPKKKRPAGASSSKKTQITTPKSHKRLIKMYDKHISVEELAHQMGMKKQAVVQKIKTENLLEDVSFSSVFDCETAEVLASAFGFEVKNMLKNREESMSSLFFGNLSAKKQSKAPVVTVMGHVNHGKTTLLDYIRKSRVASQEAGGITQHIGAYSVPVGKSFVTFIDTPGHSAFTAMRARGAKVTNIVVIVVAVDDGVQPQTVEAINHAKQAKVPVIVALNKVDVESSNPEQTKKQLMEHGLTPEEWGGDTVFCPISALKGDGVSNLLEHIHLLAEVHELKANPDRSAMGFIIESRMEKGRGCVMTLLVQEGTLQAGQTLIADNQVGRARQMTDDTGRSVSSAGPGRAVEISGFQEVTRVGEPFYAVRNEKSARRFITEQKTAQTAQPGNEEKKPSVEELLFQTYESKAKTLKLILKTDVVGSLEAIKYSIENLNTEEVSAQIIHAGLGLINESDVILATTANACLFCFNSGVSAKAQKQIQAQAIPVRSHTVIYDLLKEVETLMAGLLDPDIQESFGGRAEVQQLFPVSNVGLIAGCKVSKGKMASHHLARLIREDNIIYKGKITSLKRFKQSVKEVLEGQECGVGLAPCKDLKVGDIIESFTQKEIKRETLIRTPQRGLQDGASFSDQNPQ